MSDHILDVALRELAESQHGAVGRAQARRLGSAAAVRRRLAGTDWWALTDRVLILVGSCDTYERRAMAAVLDAGRGSVVSHLAAAALWGFPGFAEDSMEVSRPRGGTRRPSKLALVHEPSRLLSDHCGVIRGVPVTTPARTVFDLAAAVHPLRAERALDNALGRSLTTPKSLAAVVHDLAERGRPGSALMLRLMAEREGSYVPPESGLEARFFSLLRSAGLPLPERQCDVGGRDWVGRCDYLFRPFRLIAEIDSGIHHSTKLDREADARRDRELEAAGYRVLRFSDHDIWQNPALVIAVMRTALSNESAA